ncbi:MAG: glycosyltransferase family 39 protein [Candidatus Beckwithbacteria bacterium]
MKKKTILILTGILILTLLLRLFKLQELYFFTMDESLIAFRALGLFKYQRPFLIGGGSPLQVHLPPYFYYLASILLLPFNFNPISWGVSGALFGVLTVYILFLLTKKIFNKKTALIASVLYATSFTAVFFDRHFWPLSLNPIYTLTSLLLLLKLDQKKAWPYFALAGTMVMAITSDPSNLPLILTVLIFIINQRKKINLKKTYLSGLSALLVFFTPLLLFDLRHNWVNFSGVFKLFEKTSALSLSLQRLIDALLLIPRSLVRFWYSPQTNLIELHSYCISYANARQHNLSIFLVILAFGVLAWFIKKANQPILKAISFLLIFYFSGITLFGSLGYSIFDHYLTGLLPIFAIITAFTLSKLSKKLSLILLTILITFNLLQITKATNPYGLKHKQNLINWSIDKLDGQPYYLESISKCHKENGLRYLFELTNNPPQQSFMDPNFFWLYQNPPAEQKPNKILLVTDKPFESEQKIIHQQTFGAINAYIYRQDH